MGSIQSNGRGGLRGILEERRILLWTCALSLFLIGVLVQLSTRRAPAGPETCGYVGPEPIDSITVRPASFRVLLFTKHEGYGHRSIPAAEAAIHTLGARHGFTVLATEDARLFRDDALHPFAAVIFLNTIGNILSRSQKAAFERYVHAGGGFVGIHSAMDTEHQWTWYHRLLGAEFAGHPPIQPARLIVSAPSDSRFPPPPQPWERTDEWYNYGAVPRGVNVLVSVDETSYRGGTMGRFHPVTWYHEFEGGRAWYTAMGHSSCSFTEQPLLDHILGGIRYAAGVPSTDIPVPTR